MSGAFFIDKDGTLVDNSSYPPIIPCDEIMEEEVLEGLRYVKSKGYKIIIISNQPWVAKGKMAMEEVENIFRSLLEKLMKNGVEIDDYFYCPHQSSDNCDCKKPKPKLLIDAAKKHNIDLSQSFMVGDMDADVLLGKNAGIKSVLVKTGHGKEYLDIGADYVLDNVNALRELV